MNDKLRLIRLVLIASGDPIEEVDSFISKHEQWFFLWELFKAIALRNWRAGIKRGDVNFMGQMQIIGEIRKQCPATGSEPYSVNNNLAPKFALMVNAITKSDYFEIRKRKAKTDNGRIAA